MKYLYSICRNLTLFFLLIFFMFSAFVDSDAKNPMGLIVLSHGSPEPSWNNKISELLQSAKVSLPLEVAFIDFVEEKTLEKSIKNLENQGCNEILIVHLSPSSYSVHHEEIRYMVGLRKDLGIYTNEIGPPIKSDIQRFVVSPCIDDHPIVIEILTDFAKELSENPAEESLILLGHGPVEELENIMWVRQLKHIGEQVKESLGFKEIVCMTLRNDSADLIREQVREDLRETAMRLSSRGRVIVLTYALGSGMLQMEVRNILKDIPLVVFSKKGVSSHPKIVNWLEDTISKGMNQPIVPPVNRSWSHYDYETGKPRGTHRYGFL